MQSERNPVIYPKLEDRKSKVEITILAIFQLTSGVRRFNFDAEAIVEAEQSFIFLIESLHGSHRQVAQFDFQALK